MPENLSNRNNMPSPDNASTIPERELSPLSFAQERLWFLDQLQPGNPAYNIPQAWQLDGAFDLPPFETAINEIIRRHETLRTTFSRVEGKPVEIISAFQPITVNVANFSAQSDTETAVRRAMDEAARQPFDLESGPLFRCHVYRLSNNKHLALFNLHHIIADAWSFEILRRELSAVYEAALAGASLQLPELPIQYLDYAQWQREQVAENTLQSDLEFWQRELAGELPRLELPCDHATAATANGDSEKFELSAELTTSLKAIAREEGATLFTVVLAAFNAFLRRITMQTEFIVGTPVSLRSQSETEGLIGMFVNTLALRTDVSGNPTFRELLGRVRQTTFSAFAHQELPFEEIVRAVQPERALGQNPLFRVVLALHGGYPPQWKMGNLQASIVEVETHTAKFDWTLLLEESGGGLKGRLEYKTDLFAADTIKRLLRHFGILLQGIAQQPDQRISALPLLSAAEERQLLIEWNPSSTVDKCEETIHRLFEAQAVRTPDAIALVSVDQQITYQELNRRANQLARRLQQAGVGPESLVGVCLDRSPEMIFALLAILKAGGAYVPLDRSYPRERLAFMIQDAKLAVLIADAVFDLPELRGNSPKIIRVDQESDFESESPDNLPSETTAADLAYVIYTSGSTGTPKGTLIPHRGVVRLVRNPDYVTLSPSDVFLQLAPVSFDASTFEIWGCLLNGGKLVLLPSSLPSMEELGRTIEEHAITVLWLTAGLFQQIADTELARLNSVRQLLAGGDSLSVPHVLKTLRALPGCKLINGYGPTENTTFTCCHHIPCEWTGGRSVPIGKPIHHTQVYILDDHGSPLPVGVAGELFIAGDGLARGYLNRPELTQEKFYPAPILTRLNQCEALVQNHVSIDKLYRTGDLARWLPDGTIEFLGRKDQQVKIRGFRIEPGEIEAALTQHPSVREAVVIARESSAKDRELVAYVTLQNGSAFAESSLREFLQTKLPGYMVPVRIVSLPSLPLTPNGKLDHRALPAPDLNQTTAGVPCVPPRTVTEASLGEIWKEVLGRNSFGVHDNFFNLGGHSLLATQIISRIARKFSVELPVRKIFETPTIAGLAETIESAPPVDNAPAIVSRHTQRAEAHRLLDRIDELSELEIDSLLSRPN